MLLQTDILDTPDIFWDHEELEPLYHKGSGYLDLSRRTSVLNKRLDVIADLYALFRDERHVQKGHRLEWIVIWYVSALSLHPSWCCAHAVIGTILASAWGSSDRGHLIFSFPLGLDFYFFSDGVAFCCLVPRLIVVEIVLDLLELAVLGHGGA